MSDYWVRVDHDGIRRDEPDEDDAVLFNLDGEQQWVPRSLLKSYDDEEMWIPKWKAEDLGADYE